MLRTEKEYEGAKVQLSKFQEAYDAQVKELMDKKKLSKEQAESSLSSTLTYGKQYMEDVELYERLKKGDLPPSSHFSSMGRYLIAARIAKGMTQRDLAQQLNVNEASVSRDERNEYHGVSLEKTEKILKVLGCKLEATKDKELASV